MMKMFEKTALEMEGCLRDGILPFWMERMSDGRGGFRGRISGDGHVDADAPRGAVLYSRILWAFSAAYRAFGCPEYLEYAERARKWLIDKFFDKEYGGVMWSVSADGSPLETKKQSYAIGFAIYGLSEHCRATGDALSLDYAVRLYRSLEEHMRDSRLGGYFEAATRDWGPLTDVRLSGKDRNAPKTMNTHLHIIEPYTNLYRVWPDPELRSRLQDLTGIFLEKIVSPDTGHMGLFFDENWDEVSSGTVSYGHDIEASWLLAETARVLGDSSLTAKVDACCRMIARAALEGYMPDGSLAYEGFPDGSFDRERHWWVQAECAVGLAWLCAVHGETSCLPMLEKTWDYIKTHLVDRTGGEWFWSIRADGTVNRTDDKAGFWKCPYHNSRMCLEIMRLFREDTVDSVLK